MTGAAEVLVRRERWIVGGGLLFICVLSWWYLVSGAGTGMSTLAMTTWEFPLPHGAASMQNTWAGSYWVVMLLMWWVMMIAMMTPSAAPMILLYARVYRHRRINGDQKSAISPTATFAAGYLVCWLGFSIVATTLQWLLEQAGLVHSMLMWSTSNVLSSAFLIAAGVYQLTALKEICLKHCRSPLHFLMHNWRSAPGGAFFMGVKHGAFCVGCCWFLMALLFVGGIMNLIWIAGLAVLVLIEKLAPRGLWIGRLSGCAMVAGGLYLLTV